MPLLADVTRQVVVAGTPLLADLTRQVGVAGIPLLADLTREVVVAGTPLLVDLTRQVGVAGYYGKSNLERLRIDEVAALTDDLLKVIIKAFQEQDEAKKVGNPHTFSHQSSTFPRYIPLHSLTSPLHLSLIHI